VSRGGPRVVLLLVIGLLLVTETALSPFYPRLFRELYGVEDLGATGLFVWVTRVSALAALPLWGLAARRWAIPRLVVAGLAVSVALDLCLGVAPSFAAFTVLSAGLAASGSALLLAYPALVALDGERAERGPGVCLFVAVLHAGTALATVAGALILTLPDPRLGIAGFALVDAALLVLCLRVLPRDSRRRPARGTGARAMCRLLLPVTALAVLFELAVGLVRPFFTEYAASGGLGVAAAAALFLLPSLVALAVLPAAERIGSALGPALLPVALGLAALGLAIQAASPEVVPLAAGRILFGAGIGLGQVALDRRMFTAAGTAGPAYAAVETARSGALMVAPLIAALAASSALALPLGVGAALLAAAAALAPLLAAPSTSKESRVAEHAR
jgi:hypothetical protein